MINHNEGGFSYNRKFTVNGSLIFNFGKIALFTLLLISLVRVISGYGSFSFTTLIQLLGDSPKLDIATIPTIELGDWGIFNFLRDFINYFITALNGSIFIGTNMLNMLIFVFYFLYKTILVY